VVNAQDVARIGSFFLTGELDTTLYISIGGPSVTQPTHVKSRIGAQLKPLLGDKLKEGENRIISGDVLTGNKVDIENYINFYDSSISVIPEGGKREFLGMLRPGSASSRYSLTNAFLGSITRGYNFNTLKNGSERYMVPINSWEDVLPMDILPNPLYRAILAEDIEEMEQLGIFECDEEDFALCSFACPSKIDLGQAIRDGLNLIESES
jgi:Na+-transporting NADH:ubiquinone oxidoreductase, subunit NqrA